MRRIAGIVVALGLFACRCDGETPRSANLAVPCATNSDCADPLICAFGRCHAQCTTSRDCPIGQRCVLSAPKVGVCELPAETSCSSPKDCLPPLTCGPDSQCRNACAGDADCLGEQRCVESTCADVSELDDTGHLPGTHHDAGASDASDAKDAKDADADAPEAAPELGTTNAGPTSGGGAGTSSKYRVFVHAGAPAPMGGGASAKYRVTVGTRGLP